MFNLETVEIRDESAAGEQRFQLYIDGSRCALLTRKRSGVVEINWQVYGPQSWPEAKVLMQGLLELSILADQLSEERP